MTRVLSNGVQLNVEVCTGPPGALPLVLLHGFTGSAATWTEQMRALRDMCTTIALDALGHGQSDAPSDPARYTMSHVVTDTLAVLDRFAIERCALLGYSMGGRMALHVAAAAPERVAALILESASPGLRTADERAARVAADAALAARIERDGIAAFVDEWERLPLWATQTRVPDFVRHALHVQRLQNDPRGLANSLRGAGAGAQPSLWERLCAIRTPTLLIAGALDAKFAAIASEMCAALPVAQLEIVPDAGHAVHLEQPAAFEGCIRSFLVSVPDVLIHSQPI